MHTFYSHKYGCPSHAETLPSFYASNTSKCLQQQSYLTSINYHLLNQITDSETEKNYYRTKLNHQLNSHHNELQTAFSSISQKNMFLIQLEQQLDRMKKDYRLLSDEHVALKNNMLSDKQFHRVEMEALKQGYQQRIRRIQEESQKRLEQQINKRIHEIETQCEKRVQMFKSQLEQARKSSTQLSHQLKILQEDYHQMMVKNDTIIQESIHRELRKRDFEAQNNYLRDVAQYEHVKKVNQELRDEITKNQQQISQLIQGNKTLKATNLVLQTKLKDLEFAFEHEKSNNRVKLEQKFKTTQNIQTNTQQNYVPVLVPVDNNLVGELISLKQFLTEKIVSKYEEFFTKASLKEKKKSASLITFKNFLSEEIKTAKQNTIIMYLHAGLQRIAKLYCPALAYSRQFLTVKDEFVRKTLMECQGISNKQQKLFRLLELIHRLRHPISHDKCQVSNGQVKMVQIKIISTLKKLFSSN